MNGRNSDFAESWYEGTTQKSGSALCAGQYYYLETYKVGSFKVCGKDLNEVRQAFCGS